MSAFDITLMRTQQERLKNLGYYTGLLDGKSGVLTEQAFSDFKQDNGFLARPLPGPLTMTTLWAKDAKHKAPPKAVPGEPLWIAEARRLIGTKEVPGSGDNPVIMKWALDLDQWYPGDDTAWCGLFVAHCMAVGSPNTPQDFNRLSARAWREYGVEVPVGYGAIGVFWRTHPTNSWHGHVGFIVGEDAESYHVLGGNQDNMVNVTRVSKSRLLSCVGPANFKPNPKLKPVTTGDLSVNEA